MGQMEDFIYDLVQTRLIYEAIWLWTGIAQYHFVEIIHIDFQQNL
jgi:hypothetical protein